MKLKSAAGIVCYVKNMEKTIEFYEILGLEFKKKQPNRAVAYLNWYWIDFLAIDSEDKPKFKEEAQLENKGAGIYMYFSVDNVDEAYAELISKGLKPSSEPKDWPWGNREFVIKDPDGYKIVIFKRKK